MKSQLLRKTHKSGLEVPTSVGHAKRIDKKDGNDLWMKALTEGVRTVEPAFKTLDEDATNPVQYNSPLPCSRGGSHTCITICHSVR